MNIFSVTIKNLAFSFIQDFLWHSEFLVCEVQLEPGYIHLEKFWEPLDRVVLEQVIVLHLTIL